MRVGTHENRIRGVQSVPVIDRIGELESSGVCLSALPFRQDKQQPKKQGHVFNDILTNQGQG